MNTCTLHSNDYYPFGMPMPERTFDSEKYRYGFNGQEKDDEVKGKGNSLDFGARVYDSRLGKFLSIDPNLRQYPFHSSYSFAANSPIISIDRDGKFPVWIHYHMTYAALIRAKIDIQTASEIAHYASTYADHPTKGYLGLNKLLALNYLFNPGRLNYNEDKYGPYDKSYSQSDETVVAVSIHAMRTYWEDISPEEAINRALYGGKYKELDGSEVTIVGAYEVINILKGKDISKLSKEEKKLLGVALHTIQDAEIHKGGRWVHEHKDDTDNKSDHPDLYETLTAFGLGKEVKDARDKTDEAIKSIQESK